VGERPALPDSPDVLWFPKPAGMAYDDFYAELRPALSRLWRRMMVLGPAPEMCLMGADPLPSSWARSQVRREPVWPVE
jgi:hypothetical protein